MNRFARVVVTSLEGAMGQTWGGALFLDSNEGAWPIYPGENPFLDDAARARLNARRAAPAEGPGTPSDRGYLLTAADRAQLEHFRFLEILENCAGPLAFAGWRATRPNRRRNSTRTSGPCAAWSKAGRAPPRARSCSDRWRQAVRRTHRPAAAGGARREPLTSEVFAGRRDPGSGVRRVLLQFRRAHRPGRTSLDRSVVGPRPRNGLEPPGDVRAAADLRRGALARRRAAASTDAKTGWSAGSCTAGCAWPSTSHQEPRRMTADDWQARTRRRVGAGARGQRDRPAPRAGGRQGAAADAGDLPFWWRSTLSRAEWAARRCLESLAETAQRSRAGRRARRRPLAVPGAHVSRGPEDRERPAASCGHVATRAARPARFCGGQRPAHRHPHRSAPRGGRADTSAQLDAGQGLGLGALLLMGIAEGLRTRDDPGGRHPSRRRQRCAVDRRAVERLRSDRRSNNSPRSSGPSSSARKAHSSAGTAAMMPRNCRWPRRRSPPPCWPRRRRVTHAADEGPGAGECG